MTVKPAEAVARVVIAVMEAVALQNATGPISEFKTGELLREEMVKAVAEVVLAHQRDIAGAANDIDILDGQWLIGYRDRVMEMLNGLK